MSCSDPWVSDCILLAMQMLAEQDDKTSAAYQRLTWDALRKSINGLVNKVNASNVKYILPEIFNEVRNPQDKQACRKLGMLCFAKDREPAQCCKIASIPIVSCFETQYSLSVHA